MKALFALSISMLVLAGCAMPARSSKVEFLSGTQTTATEKEILENIARSATIKKKGPLMGEQLKFKNEKGYNEVSTTTEVVVYPYSQPVLHARLSKSVAEAGFKAGWSQAKIDAEVKSQVANETARLTKGKSCFAVEITTKNPEAIDLKNWKATLTTNEKSYPLTFTKGQGYTVPATYAQALQNRNIAVATGDIVSYVDACTKAPVDITQNLKLEFEPRFELDVLPSQIAWKKAYGTSKSL
jgi:hypothetical protein